MITKITSIRYVALMDKNVKQDQNQRMQTNKKLTKYKQDMHKTYLPPIFCGLRL